MTKLGWNSCQEFQRLQIYTLRGQVSGDLCRIKSWWFCAAFCRRHSEMSKSWPALSFCPAYPHGEGHAVLKRDFSKVIKESILYPCQKYDAMMPWCREWYFFLKCLSELHFVSSNLSKVWCCNREGSCDAALYFLTRSPHHDHRVRHQVHQYAHQHAHQHAQQHAHQHAHLHDGWSTYICLSTRYGGCVSLRHKCYWV